MFIILVKILFKHQMFSYMNIVLPFYQCLDTLSDLSTLPLPIMDSHMESRSAPGLVVSDIWKIDQANQGLLTQTKSEGSNISGTSNPRNMYKALVSALESCDSQQSQASTGDMPCGTSSASRIGSHSGMGSRSGSDYEEPSLSRHESQSDKSVGPRLRSISDIVRETEDVADGDDDRQGGMSGVNTPSILDTLSLQESGRFQNPSTSSQPESIDSVSINITMNKDTASTVPQTGSIGEPDGSGRESSDLIVARRSSSLARRRRTSLQRRRRGETGAIRRRRRTDSGALADALLQAVDIAPSTHVASSHDDTSPGALHCFQDEFGKELFKSQPKLKFVSCFLLFRNSFSLFFTITFKPF